MVKSYTELTESLNTDGVAVNIMPHSVIRSLSYFARRVSNALQPRMEEFINTIEQELHKYGYTLGEIDDSAFDDAGEEGFTVSTFSTGEDVRNVFLTLQYEKTAPQIYDVRSTVLINLIKLQVHEIDPADFDKVVETGEVELQSDDDFVGDDLRGEDDYDDLAEAALHEGEQMVTIKLKTSNEFLNKIEKALKTSKHPFAERMSFDKAKKEFTMPKSLARGRDAPFDFLDSIVGFPHMTHITISNNTLTLEESKKSGYQEYVKKMMDEHSFDIASATDEETKAFFMKIDKGYNAEDESGEDGLKESVAKFKKMKDSELLKALKNTRDTDESQYEAIVNEIEKRGIKEK